jgi:DNA-binding CsgD family transcriptional regulator
VKEGSKLTSTRGRPRYDDILTPREWQVIDLLEQGLTNEQIAERLQISFGGDKFHVAEIISKLGADDRHEAVRLARGKQHARAGLLGWMLTRLRFPSSKPVLLGGTAAVAVAAIVLFLGALLTNWFTLSAGGSKEDDPAAALADFESGGSQHDFLAQAQFDPNGCVTGEEARNPRHPSNGFVMPVGRDFKTIGEAERFLCLPLPRPRTSELRLNSIGSAVHASRSHDLETLMDPASAGKGVRGARIRFVSSRAEYAHIDFEVALGGPDTIHGYETTEEVRIQANQGTLFRGLPALPDAASVVWKKDGYWFHASTPRLADFGLKELLAILETVS